MTDINGVEDGSLIDSAARWLQKRHSYPPRPEPLTGDKREYQRRYYAEHAEEINARKRARRREGRT